jgi:hypothetical protein
MNRNINALRPVYAEWRRGNFRRRFDVYVVVLCRYTGRGKGSGLDVDTEGAHLWTMRDGRAVRLEVFSSRERALEAAGAG